MKTLFTLTTALSFSVAQAANFNCQVKQNYQTVLVVKFDLKSESKKFGSFEEYEFTLHNTGKRYELELYNSLEPSRTYALGDLNSSDELGLIIWNREKLMEVSCDKEI